MPSSCLIGKCNGICYSVKIPPHQTLRQLVALYEKYCQRRLKERLAAFKKKPFTTALEKAAWGKEVSENDKRITHLRRITNKALEKGCKALLKQESKLSCCKKVDEIYKIVSAVVSVTAGLGEMYAYDVALRIGAGRGILPDKVYLQRGTRAGAKNLGLNTQNQFVELADLPAGLKSLPAAEVEDFLCIFKDYLKRKMNSKI